MSHELRDLLIDVRDRVIRIEERIAVIPDMKEKQDEHERELVQAKASVKVLRWIGGALLVSLPATAAAIYKIFN